MLYTVTEQENFDELGDIDVPDELDDEDILTLLIQGGFLNGVVDDFYIDRDYFSGALAVFDESDGELLLALHSDDDEWADEESDDEDDDEPEELASYGGTE